MFILQPTRIFFLGIFSHFQQEDYFFFIIVSLYSFEKWLFNNLKIKYSTKCVTESNKTQKYSHENSLKAQVLIQIL